MRIDRDYYYMYMAKLVALRGTCNRAAVGAVLVKDNHVISTGYVGSPTGQPHCIDIGCDLVDGHCVRTIHAETNAIISAAKNGVSTQDSTLYLSPFSPCLSCAKLIVTAGIIKVVYPEEYNDRSGITLLKQCYVQCEIRRLPNDLSVFLQSM